LPERLDFYIFVYNNNLHIQQVFSSKTLLYTISFASLVERIKTLHQHIFFSLRNLSYQVFYFDHYNNFKKSSWVDL